MSCWRATASEARRFAIVDNRLAIRDVVRNVNKATQFWDSAILNVPTGGKKKKLKARVAAMERMKASIKPHVLATIRTSSR
jgi:hypothetical protein